MAIDPEVNLGPAKMNINPLYRGDDRGFQITFTDASNNPIVLPTSTWTSQIRTKFGDPTVLASFTVDASQAASGIIKLGIAHEDSVNLPTRCVYDLQLNDSGSITTYLQGTITVAGEVTTP